MPGSQVVGDASGDGNALSLLKGIHFGSATRDVAGNVFFLVALASGRCHSRRPSRIGRRTSLAVGSPAPAGEGLLAVGD